MTNMKPYAYSFSLQGKNGKLQNGAVIELEGLKVDGVDDIVSIPMNKLNPPYTVEIIAKRTGPIDYRYGFVNLVGWRYITETLQSITLYNNDQLYYHDYAANSASFNETMKEGKWYHLAITHDGTQMHLYLNGEKKKDFTPTLSSYTSGELQIGGVVWQSGQNRNFNGVIQEVRVWSTAKSETYMEDYEKIPKGTESDLVGYWKFN